MPPQIERLSDWTKGKAIPIAQAVALVGTVLLGMTWLHGQFSAIRTDIAAVRADVAAVRAEQREALYRFALANPGLSVPDLRDR